MKWHVSAYQSKEVKKIVLDDNLEMVVWSQSYSVDELKRAIKHGEERRMKGAQISILCLPVIIMIFILSYQRLFIGKIPAVLSLTAFCISAATTVVLLWLSFMWYFKDESGKKQKKEGKV